MVGLGPGFEFNDRKKIILIIKKANNEDWKEKTSGEK